VKSLQMANEPARSASSSDMSQKFVALTICVNVIVFFFFVRDEDVELE